MQKLIITTLLSLFVSYSQAAIKVETVSYHDGQTKLQGFIYWDDAIQTQRPGILVIHEWWGLNEYSKNRAKMLAELGYVAFAIDMYGKDKATQHPEQAKEWMGIATANIDQWRSRANLALELLKKHPKVNSEKTAAIGYCFGGSTVMQLAYSNAGLDGIVSFHGSLPLIETGKTNPINAKILIAHGNKDPFLPEGHVAKFLTELDSVGADWEMITFGNTEHSFTNPQADSYGIKGVRYNEQADQRSWQLMQNFFNELFKN